MIPIVVFNSLPWERVDIVECWVPLEVGKSLVLWDNNGRVPVQVLEDEEKRVEIAFVVRVSSLGYRIFHLQAKDGEVKPIATDLVIGLENRAIENWFSVDKDGELILRLYNGYSIKSQPAVKIFWKIANA